MTIADQTATVLDSRSRDRVGASSVSSCLLLVAHPGHELLAYGLFSEHRVRLMVLTDGSGGSGTPRIGRTRELVSRLNGVIAEPSGNFTDAEFYRAILTQDLPFFEMFIDQVAAVIAGESIDIMVCDAIEYYNPVHDLCGVIAKLAARRQLRLGRSLSLYSCPIVTDLQADEIRQTLGGPLLVEKEGAISPVAELISDLPYLAKEFDLRADTERLLKLSLSEPLYAAPVQEPYYEVYGRRQIASRGGGELITYAGHMKPLVDALECRERS